MALEEFRPMMERCSNCLSCKWIPFDKVQSQRFGENCPSISYYNFNTYAVRGRFQLGLALLTKDADLSDTVTKAIHSCMTCGSCDVACKVTRYNLEPLEYNLALKAHAVENGKTRPGQKEIIQSLAKEKTMIPGKSRASRTAWADGLGLVDLTKGKADVMFFAGCKTSYDEKLRNVARSSVRILERAGVKVGFLAKAEMCCAVRAEQMGFRDDFEKSARANIKLFADAGVTIIVTPCADCYQAFKRRYARLGLQVEVYHVVEYIEKLITQGALKLTTPVPMTVTYHDPCHLGRLGEPYVPWEGTERKILNQVHTWEPRRPRYNGSKGVYDAPRNVLRSVPGVKLVEMERIREYSWCCGAGGGCGETDPELSRWTASERITEANATGAEAVVTACPWCEANFRGTSDENGTTIEVLDIVELVERAL
ncbi:MAG TPA: (Fe-S)-binding protein [Spirochaetia bacterium]|nr:(Fe-S)-binding protein [Spirochaetia bacterium]